MKISMIQGLVLSGVVLLIVACQPVAKPIAKDATQKVVTKDTKTH